MSEHSHPVDKGGKEGGEASVQSYTITQQAKNYFKSVSENKEIAKLASLLSTSINSNKKVRWEQFSWLQKSVWYQCSETEAAGLVS